MPDSGLVGKRSSIPSRVGDVGGFTGVLVELCFFSGLVHMTFGRGE